MRTMQRLIFKRAGLKSFQSIRVLSPNILWITLLLTACSAGAPSTQPTEILAGTPVESSASIEEPLTEIAGPGSGQPSEVETYFKTIIFIEGTGQLMRNIDLAQLASNSVEFMPLFSIPGVMDDRVIWAQKEPLPESLAGAWDKALEAEQGLIASLENLLMMQLSQEEFLQVVAENTALASQAVAEAEAVLASGGASPEQIELLKRAALTEMGEAYKTLASLIVISQSQGNEDSD